MSVKRVVPTIATDDPVPADRFYGDLLRMDIVMDQGWIVTYAGADGSTVQVNIATEGGGGAPVPDVSVEVTNIDRVYRIAQEMGFKIVLEMREEDWGVRRFFVQDPFGKIVNVMSHIT